MNRSSNPSLARETGVDRRAMLRLTAAGAVAAAAAATPVKAKAQPGYDSLIAAERQFAADAQQGFTASFKKHIHPEGVIFRPDPVHGPSALELQEDPPGFEIDWWPAFSGLAASGDLGFNLGPVVVTKPANRTMYFLTVWSRGEDGVWKFLLDRGPRPQGAPLYPKGGPVGRLPVYDGPKIRNPRNALAEVRALERQILREVEQDVAQAFAKHAAPDAWIMGSPEQPRPTAEFIAGELKRRPKRASMLPVGAGQSAAGDMVYTYGLMTWAEGERTIPGHYARVWQRQASGWKIVADEFVGPSAPPRAAPV